MKHALAVLDRSRDLRAAVYLTRSLVETQGITGLGSGLALVRSLVVDMWDHVHPELDHEDDDDPTFRLNALAPLGNVGFMVTPVREALLIDVRGYGAFSHHDVMVALGQAQAKPGKEPPTRDLVHSAFFEGDLAAVQELAAAIETSIEAIGAIDGFLSNTLGPRNTLELDPLASECRSIRVFVAEQLARRGVAVDGATSGTPTESAGEGGAAVNADTPAKGAPATAAVAAPGEIRSREDVIRTLDMICQWFENNEPSSPVPLLLQRAKRLVSKSFLDVLRDVAPDGIKQAQVIGGLGEE
jgi:type VI secretion system protein ImpA